MSSVGAGQLGDAVLEEDRARYDQLQQKAAQFRAQFADLLADPALKKFKFDCQVGSVFDCVDRFVCLCVRVCVCVGERGFDPSVSRLIIVRCFCYATMLSAIFFLFEVES